MVMMKRLMVKMGIMMFREMMVSLRMSRRMMVNLMMFKGMMVNLVQFADDRVTADPGQVSVLDQRRLPCFVVNIRSG